jgi:hypothetical protein
METQPTPDAPAYGPPSGLSGHASDVWRNVTKGRTLSDAQLELLRQALFSLDRADAAAQRIMEEGDVVLDRYGTPKMHPAVDIEARHRGLYARLMNQLNIDGVAKQIGRPGSASGASAKARRLRAV